MSILIKNIKMPKDEHLLVKIDPDGTVSTTARNNYKKYEAVELPTQHGRLIDVSELEKRLYDYGTTLPIDWSDIANAPTVIEAERGG